MRRSRSCGGALALVAALLVGGISPAGAANPPTVTGSQSAPANSGVGQVTIDGTGFFASGGSVPQITITKAGRTLAFSGEALLSSTRVTGKVDLTGEQPGYWTIRVTNPDGKSGTYGDGVSTGLRVTGSTPVITNVIPGEGVAGSNDLDVELVGSNFARGALVRFADGSDSNTDIAVESATYISQTRYRVTIDIPAASEIPVLGVKIGKHDIRMTNEISGTCGGCFTVRKAPGPEQLKVTSVNPGAASNSASVALTIKGREFDAGKMEARLVKDGLTIDLAINGVTDETNPLSDDTVHATADLTGQAPGTYSLKVTNTGSQQTGTLANAFTIGALAPSIAKVTPGRVLAGVDSTMTITGSNFARGDKVLLGSGATVDNVTVKSRTEIEAVVRGSSAKADRYDVTVQHTDGQFATCAECLSILPANPGWLLSDDFVDGAERAFTLGAAGDTFLACDWDRDGVDEPVTFRAGRWKLYSSTTSTTPSVTLVYGVSTGDRPVCGDWNKDGRDTIGIYRKNGAKGEWWLRNTNSGGAADLRFAFGDATDIPVVGDWDGDGDDTIGVYRPGPGRWYLRNTNSAGLSNIRVVYGVSAGDRPVAGDWNGDRRDTPGIRRGDVLFLNNTFIDNRTAVRYEFGPSGGAPVAGKWKPGVSADRTGVVVT